MNKKEELISIIVPVYKVEKYLNKCIESILNQTYKNLEIFLIDDGSPDRCGEICDEYAKKDYRVKVIHKDNGGQGSARNCALRVLKGQYIMFVDSDDWVSNDIVESLYNAMADNECDISTSGYFNVIDGVVYSTSHANKKTISFDKIQALRTYYERKTLHPAPWGKLYKTEIWKDVFFPENVFREDEYIFYKILERAKKVFHIGEAKYYYNIREGSAEHSKFALRNLVSNESIDRQYEFISKKYPELQQLVWDCRIETRIRQIHDMSVWGVSRKYKSEFEEMLQFIKDNKPYSKEMANTCADILKYRERYFFPQTLKFALKRILQRTPVYWIVRKVKNRTVAKKQIRG